MNVKKLKLGSTVKFAKCGECTGKLKCYFCKPGVKNTGEVVARWPNFDIPTVEVKVKGSEALLELTQDDLDDPCLVIKAG